MATTNKALTTYLPDESVEWLERYCLDYKHLLNKEGNPKLGTALADIVSRLADGELTLPPKIEQTSTVVDNAQYGTEIASLKGEIEELKKVVTEYSTNNVPSTLPDDSLKGEVEALGELIAEIQEYTQSQFAAVRDELKKALSDRAVIPTDAIAKAAPLPSKTKPNENEPEWVNSDNRGFYKKLVGNSELLDKVAEAIDSASGNNAVLAESLVRLGFHKQDGKTTRQ